MKKLSELTSPFVFRAYHLDDDMPFVLRTVMPEELISRNRLDIMAKILYLKLKDTAPAYARSLYLEHIRVMTRDSFEEAGSKKSGKQAFLDSFAKLYEDMKASGYSEEALPVPVAEDLQPVDGAHRIACAAVLGIPVNIVVLPVKAEYDSYPYGWFRERGMDEEFLDQMVLEYVRRRNTGCFNIWPSAKGHDEEVRQILQDTFGIVYEKEVTFNENGAFHYLAQIYAEYSWAQDHDGDGFAGVYRKLVPCFPSFDPVRVFFVDAEDGSRLTETKEKLRGLFDLEKHSMHATDSTEESRQMAEILLSPQTVRFLNRCQSTRFSNTFELLKQGDGFDYARTVLTGSIVLALYGMRRAEDLDFISLDDIPGSHNDLLKYYGMTKEEAVFSPAVSFTYFGRRFLTLECIKKFKENRGEGKDRDDLVLIREMLENDGRESLKVRLLQKKRRAVAAAQGVILKAAHRTGTYDLLRAVYKKLKGQKS